jgi:hypothetical protein
MAIYSKFALLALALSLFQSEPARETPQKTAAPAASPPTSPIVLEVAPVPMNGVWYQDGRDHVHDSEVKLAQVYRRPGLLRVTLSTGKGGGTDIEFNFSHNDAGSTLVNCSAFHHQDVMTEGSTPEQRLRGLQGRVVVHTDDWGPGKTLICTFAVEGTLEQEKQFLLGSFLVLIPPGPK